MASFEPRGADNSSAILSMPPSSHWRSDTAITHSTQNMRRCVPGRDRRVRQTEWTAPFNGTDRRSHVQSSPFIHSRLYSQPQHPGGLRRIPDLQKYPIPAPYTPNPPTTSGSGAPSAMDEYTFPRRSVRPQAQGNASASSSGAGPTPDSQAGATAAAQDVAAPSAQPAPPPASFLSAQRAPLRRASMGDMGTPYAPSSLPSSMPHGDFPSYYTSEVTAPPHVARPQPLPDPERPTTSWWARPSHRLLPEVQTQQHLGTPQGSTASAYWVPASSQLDGQVAQTQHQTTTVDAILPQHPALVPPQAPALAPLSESSVGPVGPPQLLEPTQGSTHQSSSRTPVWGSLGPSPDPRPVCHAW